MARTEAIAPAIETSRSARSPATGSIEVGGIRHGDAALVELRVIRDPRRIARVRRVGPPHLGADRALEDLLAGELAVHAAELERTRLVEERVGRPLGCAREAPAHPEERDRDERDRDQGTAPGGTHGSDDGSACADHHPSLGQLLWAGRH